MVTSPGHPSVSHSLQLLGEALDHALDGESLANVASGGRSHAQTIGCRSHTPQQVRKRRHVTPLVKEAVGSVPDLLFGAADPRQDHRLAQRHRLERGDGERFDGMRGERHHVAARDVRPHVVAMPGNDGMAGQLQLSDLALYLAAPRTVADDQHLGVHTRIAQTAQCLQQVAVSFLGSQRCTDPDDEVAGREAELRTRRRPLLRRRAVGEVVRVDAVLDHDVALDPQAMRAPVLALLVTHVDHQLATAEQEAVEQHPQARGDGPSKACRVEDLDEPYRPPRPTRGDQRIEQCIAVRADDDIDLVLVDAACQLVRSAPVELAAHVERNRRVEPRTVDFACQVADRLEVAQADAETGCVQMVDQRHRVLLGAADQHGADHHQHARPMTGGYCNRCARLFRLRMG